MSVRNEYQLTPHLLSHLSRTLEELDYIFAVPNRVFIKYQTSKALPYWISRYVKRNKNARLEPLYQMDEDELALSSTRSRGAAGKGDVEKV